MISVIIPTFNRREMLKRAVDSVLEQTFEDWELIVVDDGSTDGSGEMLGQLPDGRIRCVRQPHQGVSAARNHGIRLARHPWICFLDSDDYWLPSKLQRQMETLGEHPSYRAVFTDEIWIRRGRRVNPRKTHRKYGGWIYRHCLPRCIISPSSILIHRDLIDREAPFDEAFPACEDYDLWLRLTARHPVFFLEEQLIVKTGGHSDQLSRSVWGLDRYRLRALQSIHGSGRLTPQQWSWTTREIVHKAAILAAGYGNRGKREEAEKYRHVLEEFMSSPDYS